SKSRGLCGWFAAAAREYANDEIGGNEWFGEVVVGAEREPGDAVVRRAGGGEHQDHRWFVRFCDHPAQGVAVDSREIAVEDDDVIRVEVELALGLGPVVGDVDGDPLVAQAFGDP